MMHVSIAARPAAPPVSADAPRILVIATMPWMFPARLAKALRRVGFQVESVCQAGHALRCLEVPIAAHRLGWLQETGSIETAIERFEPDLLVPCDDPAVANLHTLYRQTRGPDLAALIERSLGSPESFAVTAKGTTLVAYARHLGLRGQRSEGVGDAGALGQAARRIGYPCVLKRDRSWSGIGVTPVESEADLGRAWSVGGSVGLLQAAKAMV